METKREGDQQLQKDIYLGAIFKICLNLTQILRLSADAFWQGRAFTWIERIPFCRDVGGGGGKGWATQRGKGQLLRTSTVWDLGLRFHQIISKIGHFLQCPPYSRTRKKKSVQRLNSTLKSQFLITIANNESSWNPCSSQRTEIIRTDITVSRPD